MRDDKFARFVHPTVLAAPNLPTGAYQILRNEILANSIGGVLLNGHRTLEAYRLARMRQNQAGKNDPIARRWRTLMRDFPHVLAMVEVIHPEREEMRALIGTGPNLGGMFVDIIPANKESVDAVKKAIKCHEDLSCSDGLVAFTKRLAIIDKDARFHVRKVSGAAQVELKKARYNELVQRGEQLKSRFPGLWAWVTSESNQRYHPIVEEAAFRPEESPA